MMSAGGVDSGAVRPLERGHPWDARFCLRSPLYAPIEEVASAFAGFDEWPAVTDIDAALAEKAGIHFQEQPPRVRRRRRGRRLPIEAESLYDARISLAGWVPTRARNWHDFLNALVWASFPRAKHAFHARQHAAVAARIQAGDRVLPGVRTRELDGLAILDEGGLLLLVEDSLEKNLTDWIDRKDFAAIRSAIVERRVAALPFGHALYETLLGGHAAATWAMVTVLPSPEPLPQDSTLWVKIADERLTLQLGEANSFANPDTFRNLPLDADLLFSARNP
jgi:Protein of unknown function (DUF3025)